MLDDKRYEFLARVASMYYEDNLTQSEVARNLGYSRSAISRFLTEARDAGVVEIRINHPLSRNNQLERDLRNTFGLRDVRILQRGGISYPKMLARLGRLTGQMLDGLINERTTLGVSYGTGVHAVATALRPTHYPGVKVIQLIGASGTPDPQIDGPELAQMFARAYGGTYLAFPAPLLVDNETIRNAIMSDSYVRDMLALTRHIDVAIVGIGTTEVHKSGLVRAGHIPADELKEIAAQGAAGDVCAIHYSIDGEILDLPIQHRTIGVGVDTLREIPFVIGVAGGEAKAEAIHGAIRAGLVNVIVTDDVTASLALSVATSRSEK
jgi:DNA-binding transcriptional regulator LsrR (DeoR family)